MTRDGRLFQIPLSVRGAFKAQHFDAEGAERGAEGAGKISSQKILLCMARLHCRTGMLGCRHVGSAGFHERLVAGNVAAFSADAGSVGACLTAASSAEPGSVLGKEEQSGAGRSCEGRLISFPRALCHERIRPRQPAWVLCTPQGRSLP